MTLCMTKEGKPDGALLIPCGNGLAKACMLMSGIFLDATATGAVNAEELSSRALMALSLEELSNIRIMSVNRRDESIATAAASVYVITSDDIRRSGATTIPGILQLAPNLQVAQIDSLQFAITARGFNNAIGNKLLVLIDGRTIYTPLFSGVFWEMQDTFIQDIERIEVISGPGATLWGANAVNGVINVITKQTSDTLGTLVTGEAGDREGGAGFRVGVTTSADAALRFYAKTRRWDNTLRNDGSAVPDGWTRSQLGFRADWHRDDHQITLQGDAHQGESERRGYLGALEISPVEVSGMNLLARWSRESGDMPGFRLQAYWNHSERDEMVLFSPTADILDLEFQQNTDIGNHRLVWGGGYRYAEDDVGPGIFTAFIPASRHMDWLNVFVQDEIKLASKLSATIGLKLEENDYTGTEYLPRLSAAWSPGDNHLLWTAFSRAVRAPSRFDRDVFLPHDEPFFIAGGPEFISEVAKVVELGYRGQLSSVLNFSMTFYHHDWRRLRSGTMPPFPTYLSNGIEGDVFGVEAWFNWQVASHWRISGGLTSLDKNLAFSSGSGDTSGINNSTLHNDPDHQWQMRSSVDLLPTVLLDLNLRRVAALTVEPVPAYTELNARLAWKPLENVEIAVTGRNLLHKDHAEFAIGLNSSRIDRSLLLGLHWTL